MTGPLEGLKAALETTKQLITLSTGVIVFTVTFLEKIVEPSAGTRRSVPWELSAAWVCFAISILSALFTLGAITSLLNLIDHENNGHELAEEDKKLVGQLALADNIKWPGIAMSLSFLTGMIFTVWTGFVVL